MAAKKLFTNIALIVFIIVFSTTGFSKEKLVESKWSAQPLKIDGQDDDWGEDVLTSEESVSVDFAVRNDAKNMYVLFIFKDPKSLSTINATGITLYYNTEGKKKKDCGFLFIQKKVTPDELIAYLEKQGEVLTEERKQTIKAQPAYVVFIAEKIGKKDKEASEATRVTDILMPAFRISQRGEEFIYEFRVPLANSGTIPEGMGVEPGQSLKIGFEWGGMTKELTERLSGRIGGDISRESGAGTVIDSRRNAGRSPSGGTRGMPKKHSFWLDVKLAQIQ